ncbi:MAG: mucoidy inhibitor MuiA family protein [Bacteroidota bacterium]
MYIPTYLNITRAWLGLLLVLALPQTVFSADSPERPFPSEVTAVTVYLQGAQVNRTASVPLVAGRQTLVFTNLTTKADPESVQFSLNGAEVQVLSVRHRINFVDKAEEDAEDAALRSQLAALDRRERRLQTEAAINKEEEAILQANRSFGSEDTGLDPDQLARAVTYHRERLTTIRMGYLAIEDSLSSIAEDRQLILATLAQRGLDRQRPATGEVVVLVESKSVQTVAVGLAYLVPNASWTPIYDVRVDDIAQPLDLRYRARVTQNSGEDWGNVQLTLSTGDPNRSASAPQLPTWRLANGSYPPTYVPATQAKVKYGLVDITGVVTDDATNEALIGATVLVEGTEIGTVTDLNGNFTLSVPADRQKLQVNYTGYDNQVVLIKPGKVQDIRMGSSGATLDEVVVTGRSVGVVRSNLSQRMRLSRRSKTPPPPPPVQVERRATTVAFLIDFPYDIPSDGQARSVDVRRYAVPATFQHFAVPKLVEEVFLTAAVANWEQYDLINGEMQLFFEGNYLGTSTLQLENLSDTLTLSLGQDPSVIISRETDRSVGKRGGFLAGKATQTRAYEIKVRNTKNRPISLRITVRYLLLPIRKLPSR